MAIPEYGNLHARRDARDRVSGPGKFEGESSMAPILWDMVLSGFADSECACDVSPLARVGKWTLRESESGFVYAIRHESADEAQNAIDECDALTAHEWQTARFTGAVTCARCGLLPLDDDDMASECEGAQ